MTTRMDRPLRVLIVDDEAPARARLRRLLAEVEREGSDDDAIGAIEVAGEASSGDEAVAQILAVVPDLVLLDIQMPGRDGFGVIEAVGPEAMPPVAFVTAYDEHALRAFEVHAIDYLLKPVPIARLTSVLRRARRAMEGATPRAPQEADRQPDDADRDDPLAARLTGLLASLERPAGYLQRIMVHQDERAFLVPVSRIVRISADRNVVRLHAVGAEYVLRTPITALEARLDPDVFLRINRSDIVRLDAIQEMHPWSHGDYQVVLTDGTRLVWSRRYRARAGDRFGT